MAARPPPRTLAPFADIQKLSKQAIYALHRGDGEDAAAKLVRAEELACKLAAFIGDDSSLRHGSFSAALEEVRAGGLMRRVRGTLTHMRRASGG